MDSSLACYGGELDSVAALVGDFDLRSPAETHAWLRIEWQAIADVIGFGQQLDAALASVRAVRDDGTMIHRAGAEAFARWLARTPAAISEAQAQVQWSVLEEVAGSGRERWHVTVDPTSLRSGACYRDGDQMLRAFYPDTAGGYFGDGWEGQRPKAESACGWTTALSLHLGTFPYVYSTRMDGPGPGLRWVSAGVPPAVAGMRVMAAMMQPANNLRQDAAQVAAIFEHFRAHTARLVAMLPAFRPGQVRPGTLYRRGGFLHVHQGSLAAAGLQGPRGYISAPAYNYILRRFACFLAVRRAALRAVPYVPALMEAARASLDPCVRRQLGEEVARAG